MPISTFALNTIADQAYRATGTFPANLYVALYSTTISDFDAGTGTQFTGTGYARQAVLRAVGSWDAPAAGDTQNTNLIQFTASAPGDWPAQVLAVGVFDALTLGNFWGGFNLAAAVNVNTGSPVEIPAGGLDLTSAGV